MSFVVVVLAFTGCSKLSGEMVSSHFSVSTNYEELCVSDGFEVEFSQDVADILITVDENLLSKVVVSEADGKLTIGLKPMISSHGSTMKAVLPFSSDINKVSLSGGSTLLSPMPIKGKELEIHLSGSSQLMAELNVEEVEVNLSGASVAEVSGVCNELDVDLSGASEIVSQHDTHYDFSASMMKGSMSGSSTATLHCDGSIGVKLSGGSIIRYTGDARTEECTLTGNSKIVRDVF